MTTHIKVDLRAQYVELWEVGYMGTAKPRLFDTGCRTLTGTDKAPTSSAIIVCAQNKEDAIDTAMDVLGTNQLDVIGVVNLQGGGWIIQDD